MLSPRSSKPRRCAKTPRCLRSLLFNWFLCCTALLSFLTAFLLLVIEEKTPHFDHIKSAEVFRLKRGALDGGSLRKWSNKDPEGNIVIPYDIGSLNPQMTGQVRSAMSLIEKGSCLRYKPKTPQDQDFISFKKTSECETEIGRKSGPNDLQLADSCFSMHIALQLLLMKVGLDREELRPDRDKYVTIVNNLIKPELLSKFSVDQSLGLVTHDLPYDYDSATHSAGNAGAKDPNTITIRTNDTSKQPLIGKATTPSKLDFEKLHKIYDCGGGEHKDGPDKGPPKPGEPNKPGDKHRNSEQGGYGFGSKDRDSKAYEVSGHKPGKDPAKKTGGGADKYENSERGVDWNNDGGGDREEEYGSQHKGGGGGRDGAPHGVNNIFSKRQKSQDDYDSVHRGDPVKHADNENLGSDPPAEQQYSAGGRSVHSEGDRGHEDLGPDPSKSVKNSADFEPVSKRKVQKGKQSNDYGDKYEKDADGSLKKSQDDKVDPLNPPTHEEGFDGHMDAADESDVDRIKDEEFNEDEEEETSKKDKKAKTKKGPGPVTDTVSGKGDPDFDKDDNQTGDEDEDDDEVSGKGDPDFTKDESNGGSGGAHVGSDEADTVSGKGDPDFEEDEDGTEGGDDEPESKDPFSGDDDMGGGKAPTEEEADEVEGDMGGGDIEAATAEELKKLKSGSEMEGVEVRKGVKAAHGEATGEVKGKGRKGKRGRRKGTKGGGTKGGFELGTEANPLHDICKGALRILEAKYKKIHPTCHNIDDKDCREKEKDFDLCCDEDYKVFMTKQCPLTCNRCPEHIVRHGHNFNLHRKQKRGTAKKLKKTKVRKTKKKRRRRKEDDDDED